MTPAAPRVQLYETTLSDGTQRERPSLSVNDKLRIAPELDALGVDYIGGGWHGSHPKDAECFGRGRRPARKHALLAALGGTRSERDGGPATPAGATTITTIPEEINILNMIEA